MCVLELGVCYFKNMIIGSENNSKIKGVKIHFLTKMSEKSLKID